MDFEDEKKSYKVYSHFNVSTEIFKLKKKEQFMLF